MKNLVCCLSIVALAVLASPSFADIIIDSTGDNINQANLTADSGQTFTTGSLTDTLLSTIIMTGPAANGVATTYGIEISLNGAAHNVWLPGTSLGEVGPIDTFGGATFDFTSLGINLTDNTVYSLRFTDGAGTSFGARVGLSNGAAGGTGGSAPGAFADGTLFSNGNTVFGDGFDTAMSVSTISAVPEPGSCFLFGIGMFGLAIRRRRIG